MKLALLALALLPTFAFAAPLHIGPVAPPPPVHVYETLVVTSFGYDMPGDSPGSGGQIVGFVNDDKTQINLSWFEGKPSFLIEGGNGKNQELSVSEGKALMKMFRSATGLCPVKLTLKDGNLIQADPACTPAESTAKTSTLLNTGVCRDRIVKAIKQDVQLQEAAELNFNQEIRDLVVGQVHQTGPHAAVIAFKYKGETKLRQMNWTDDCNKAVTTLTYNDKRSI